VGLMSVLMVLGLWLPVVLIALFDLASKRD
jgi:hypothetical protein